MKILVLLLTCMLLSLHLCGQENIVLDKITLKTGDVYVGKIVLKTADMIMIATKDGTRYQFQLSEIKATENQNSDITLQNNNEDDQFSVSSGNFGGMVELTTGISNAKYCFGWSPNAQISLMFGNKKMLGESLFFAAGIGYNSTFIASPQHTIAFLPLFIRLQSTLSKKRNAPFVGMDAGYAVGLNSANGGGALIKISAGISRRINNKSSLIVGIYAGVQSFSGKLTETNELGIYSYPGKTTMNNLGLKVGLLF